MRAWCSLCQTCLTLALAVPFSFFALLMCRTNAGIGPGTNHLKVFTRASELSNVIALDDSMPHTLPSGLTFFRVQESRVRVKAKNIRVDKFLLLLQVSNPDALEYTSACLSDDKRVVIITMAGPDKFCHTHRAAIGSQLAEANTPGMEEPEIQVRENYVSHMSAADSKAVEHLTVEDIDINLAMKKMYCVLPPGVLGSNEYFNDGDG